MLICCCGGGCTGSVYLQVTDCCQFSTGPSTSPTVTCVGPTGASVPVTTSGGNYTASLTTQGSGTYTFTISQSGYYSRTVTGSGSCGSSHNLGTIYLRPTTLTFDVASLCGGLNGTTLTLTCAYSLTQSISGTGAQTVVVDVPDIPGNGIPPDYTATVSQSRYVDVSQNYSWGGATSGSFLWLCSGSGLELFLNTLADCYVCCDGCDYPTTDYFSISTPIGTVVVPYNAGPVGISGSCTGYASDQCCSGTTSSVSVPFIVNCNCIFQDYPSVIVAWNACLGTNIPCLNTSCDGCGTGGSPYFQGLASVVWSSSSCSPYTWTGTLVGADFNDEPGHPNPIPDCLSGTWTLSEVACSYESGTGGTTTPGSGTVTSMSLPKQPLPPFENLANDTSKIRVGFVAPCLVRGGAETWQLSLAKSLDDRFEVVGVAITTGIIDPKATADYRDICPVSEGYDEVVKLAKNCDVLVTWGQRNYARLWRHDKHRPILVSVAHLPQGDYGDVADVDDFVGVSSSAVQAIPPHARKKATVIPNAVDAERLVATRSRQEVRQTWGVSDTAFVAGYLGRLAPEKNPSAMVELARHANDIEVVLVGDGSEHQRLTEMATGLENFHLVGGDSHPGDVLRAFDALIVPSDFESFGLSIAEACSLGIPVISTSVGIAREFPGITRVVDEATGPKLWEAVQEDRRDTEGTTRRVAAAKLWADENASLDVFGQRWSNHLAGLRLRPRRGVSKGCGCGSAKKREIARRRLNQ
jgi:glycosyltransferase involved in cell wall biosynthesis